MFRVVEVSLILQWSAMALTTQVKLLTGMNLLLTSTLNLLVQLTLSVLTLLLCELVFRSVKLLADSNKEQRKWLEH